MSRLIDNIGELVTNDPALGEGRLGLLRDERAAGEVGLDLRKLVLVDRHLGCGGISAKPGAQAACPPDERNHRQQRQGGKYEPDFHVT